MQASSKPKPQQQTTHKGGQQKGKQATNGGPTQAPKRRKRGQRKPRGDAPATTAAPVIESPKEEEDKKELKEEVSSHSCLICCDPIKLFSVGVCNHRSICYMCSLRRRELYKQLECCLCKVSNYGDLSAVLNKQFRRNNQKCFLSPTKT